MGYIFGAVAGPTKKKPRQYFHGCQSGLVNAYNKKVTDESSSLMNDHQYSSDSLLTLDIPELSACSPSVRRLRKRITQNSSLSDMSSPSESLSLSVSSDMVKNK